MSSLQQMPVADLVVGLHVSELDRPWLESPFLFQGFRIDSEAELQQLRECCEYVYVDPEQSDPDALAKASDAPRSGAGEAGVAEPGTPGATVRRRELEGLFGKAPEPDPARFHAELRQAATVREKTRAVVDELMHQIRAGGSVDSRQAQAVVKHLVRAITRNTTASLWLNNLKKRDEYTAIHCMNVCVLALAFGRHLGMDREALEILGLGALLHDVGKMQTPDAVLNKPGRLTEEEFAIMRRHPVEGYEVMRQAGNLPEGALEIIRLHHERVSGRGYPDGLAGDEIPLSVRVAAIADVYDAMTSDRVYKKGVTPDRAIRIMYENAAEDFGRDLVQAFIRCVGIFPVGSLVELDTGALGVVVSSLPEARLKPVLRMVRTPTGEAYRKRLVLNLAAMDNPGAGEVPTIRRVVDGAEHGIDVAALTRAELGKAS